MTEKLKRLHSKLADLETQRRKIIRTLRFPPASLDKQIADTKKEIEEAEAYEPQRLSKLIPYDTLERDGVVDAIIKTHIAADYLCDCAMDVRCKLEKLGLHDCSLYPLVSKIEELSA